MNIRPFTRIYSINTRIYTYWYEHTQCLQNTPIKWFRNEIKCHNDMVKCDVGTQIFSRYVTFDPSTLTVKVCANFEKIKRNETQTLEKEKNGEYRCWISSNDMRKTEWMVLFVWLVGWLSFIHSWLFFFFFCRLLSNIFTDHCKTNDNVDDDDDDDKDMNVIQMGVYNKI